MAPIAQRSRSRLDQPTATRTETTTEVISPPNNAERTENRSRAQVQTHGILRLRGAHSPGARSVRWASDVVDNEGLGKKSSKVCCIYRRPHDPDQSSEEESSSSDSDSSDDSDSDSDSDSSSGSPSAARRPLRRAPADAGDAGHCHDHDHDHDHDHNHDHEHHHHHHRCGERRGRGKRKSKSKQRKPSPNAYERMPRYNKPKKDGPDGGGAAGAPQGQAVAA